MFAALTIQGRKRYDNFERRFENMFGNFPTNMPQKFAKILEKFSLFTK